MPRIGIPRSNTCFGMVGAPSSYTEDGPPDSTMPTGSIARSFESSGSLASVYGWISQYTACSRIRRAISCVYCDPKSRTTTTWCLAMVPCAPLLEPVVRSFLGDDHVVDVTLAEPRRGNPHELRLGVEVRDRRATEIAHRGAQPADQLVQRLAQRALVRHATLDAFGNQLRRRLDVGLEVAVLRPFLHRADRSHAAIRLIRAALIQDDLARRLVGTGEQRTDHHGVGAGGQGLRDVARVLDAAVTDDRDTGALGRADRIADRGELRHADAGD